MKKKIYDILGEVNAVMCGVCYRVSRALFLVRMPNAGVRAINLGSDCATTAMKCWIKSVDVGDCEDIIVPN